MTSELPALRALHHPPRSAADGTTVPRAANDNHHGFTNDVLLRAALRHFAEHGLGAAEQARQSAERAFFAGDRADYDWWLAICRTLDRRMAAAVAARRART